MFQRIQFFIAPYVCHDVEHLQLCFVEYSSFHNQLYFSLSQGKNTKFLRNLYVFLPIISSRLFPSLSKNAQAERNGKSCLYEFADCRGAAVVL